ncbi:MAG: FtsX-like permease family protein [Cytophagales bacterium]|nr:MAG: FtsX-like permease family protein [Cytophagales bacterium]
MIKNYFTVAWRNLVRNKLHTFINVLGLSIGISSCLVIFLIVKYELSFDTFHKDKERIYRVVSQINFSDNWHKNHGVPAALPFAVRNEVTGLENIVAFHEHYAKISVPNGDKKPIRIETKSKKAITEPEYFQLFEYEWLKGSAETALDKPNQVVLTEKQAKLYFGESEAMGRQLLYGDSLWVTVSGIVKDFEQASDFAVFTDFISFSSIKSNSFLKKNYELENWNNINSSSMLFLKLSKGANTEEVEKQIIAVGEHQMNTEKEEERFERKFALQPLAGLHFDHEYGNFERQAHLPTLYALMLIATVLLLIACINFINLETAQAVYRAKEVGIRKVLGSSRKNLIFQFLGETSIITFIAVLFSIFLAEQALFLFSDYIPKGLSFQIFELLNLLFLFAILLVVSFLSGLYPAFVLSAFSPVLAMKNQISTNNSSSRKAYLRKTLIVTQFTVSQAFIIGTLIIGSQIDFMLQKDMGFKKDEIVTFSTPWFWNDEDSVKQKLKYTLVDRIKQIPEIQQVSLSGNIIADRSQSTTILKFKKEKEILEHEVHRKSGDSSYIPLFGLKLLAGRNISNSDSMVEVVINESYSKLLGFKNPQEAVGQAFTAYSGAALPIVGVIKDFHIQPMHKAIAPTFITCEGRYLSTINLKMQTKGKTQKEMQGVMAKIERIYNEIYPDTDDKFDYTWFDDRIAKFYESEQKMAKLMQIATFLAILISSLGLFGLVSFMVNQRTKEIGVRKVLGASVSQITFLLSKDFLKLVGIAFFIAIPIAYYAIDRWLADFAYKVGIAWELFAFAGLGAIVIALLTVSYKSVKAALTNPVNSLRSE